jgi:hypothetical protein
MRVPVLVVEMVPLLVVEMVPVLVVEMVPVLVVEMVPVLVVEMVQVFATPEADKAKTNMVDHTMDLRFFIVLLLSIEMSGVTWVGSEICLVEPFLRADL